MKNTIFFTIFSFIFFLSCKNDKQQKDLNNFEGYSKPNIIYILADDLGYGDLSFTGQTKFKTPNIDKLAETGMVFTQHYSGATVCAPSRSALLTGMHTGHTAIRGNKEVFPEGQYPLPKNTYTLAAMLKGVGYKTSVFGKWGLGYPGSEGDPNRQGFDEFFGYNCQRLAHNYYPYHLWHNQEKIILKGNQEKNQVIYAPDVIHEKALNFIEANKNTPFFMLYATPLPHAELLLPENYIVNYKGKFLPEKKYYGIDDGPDYKNGGYGSQENSHAAFAAMISHLDSQVGDIVTLLDKLGMSKNTIIIFTSDNGPHHEGGADPDYFNSNAIYKGYKRDLYEGGIHVPMIVKWPNKIKHKSSSSHISAFWDVMPTLADIVDAKLTHNIDGISFLPTLLGKSNQIKHEYLYWEFHEMGGRMAIRKGKWKGVKYDLLKKPDQIMELYDLEIDPSEKINLATEYPKIVEDLEFIMKDARKPSEIFQITTSTD